MTKELVSRAEFARRAGVNQSAITRACSGKLKTAVEGKRINARHPTAVWYIGRQEKMHAQPAAVGLDPLYEMAVEACITYGKWSPSALRKPLGIGSVRAARIWKTIEAAGLVPSMEERADGAVAPVEKPVIKGYAARNNNKKSFHKTTTRY